MTGVTFSAPGKAIVSGEYAVLVGAPAIAVAINRRASVHVEAVDGEVHQIRTQGFLDGTWHLRMQSDGVLAWQNPPPEPGLKLIEHVFSEKLFRKIPPLAVEIDTRGFSDTGTGKKLGLGSSAAAMTALVAALCHISNRDADMGSIAHQAHAAFQGGVGSGVDVATSITGGTIGFHRSSNANPLALSWPRELSFRVLWSGHPAETADRIHKLARRNLGGESWSALGCAASDVFDAWCGGQAEEILVALRAYAAELRQFSRLNELGVFVSGHEDLYGMAAEHDVVYKPCGAGGGDIGIVCGRDTNAVDTFCKRARKTGFSELQLKIDEHGVEQVPPGRDLSGTSRKETK